MSYFLIDSGDGQKFENFGPYKIIRPCAQAVWRPALAPEIWKDADATFSREPQNKWHQRARLPASWEITWKGVMFKVMPTDFGHVGLFPEHGLLWDWMGQKIEKNSTVLNLFAYTGGASLAAAKAGAKVCHVDASKAIVAWARENAEINQLQQAPIRWIVDDVLKFLRREVKRGVRYDGIILDPPTFGRGNQGEVFKIENDLIPILECCQKLLSPQARFLILTCHTPGYTPLVLNHLLSQTLTGITGRIEAGEMIIPGPLDLPSGTYARWHA